VKTETIIKQLRRVRQPVRVKHGHCPRWFKTKLADWIRANDAYQIGFHNSVTALLDGFCNATDWHIDHWGTSYGGSVFVNEPYNQEGGLEKNREVAAILGLRFTESDNSFWYPGSTKRYEFTP